MMFNNSAILGLSSLGRVDITKTFYSFNNENCILVSNYDSEFSFQLYPHQIASKYKFHSTETVSIFIPADYYKFISLQNSNQRSSFL